MSLKKITSTQLLEYVKTLIPDNAEAEKNTRTVNARNKILELHESGIGADIHRGSAFGAYNAVTNTSITPNQRTRPNISKVSGLAAATR